MANKRTTSYVQDGLQADECRENIPPEESDEAGTSTLKVSADNETLHSSQPLCEENEPVCATSAVSSPAPTNDNGEVVAKSDCQLALTPILKSLNIDNICSSSHFLKQSNSPHLSFSFSSMNFSQLNCQPSTTQSGRPFCDLDVPFCTIEDECLPEVTGLDFTCMQLTTNDPVLPENESSKFDNEVEQVQTNAAEDNDDPLELLPSVNTTVSTDLDGKVAFWSKNTNAPAAIRIVETEITLLDASTYSVLSPVGQITYMNSTQDLTPADHLKDKITLSELSRQIVSDPGSSVTAPNEDLSNTSVHSVMCATKATIRTSLDAMMVSVLEKSDSSESRGQKIEKTQTPDKDEVGAQFALTQTISSISDMSAQSAHLSTSGVNCNTTSAGVASDVHSGPAENTDLVKVECEEVQNSCDTKSNILVSQQNHTWTASRNKTFSLLQSSNSSVASDCNSTTSASCPEIRTFDLSGTSAKAEGEISDQAKFVTTKTLEKESSKVRVQNSTFDRNFLQITCDNSTSGEAAAAIGDLQNTFDSKDPSQKNCTVTLSEISSGDSRCNILNEPFSPKSSTLATHPEDEDHSSELPKPETAAAAKANHDKDNSTSGDAAAAIGDHSLQNTFDSKDPSQKNCTVTLSEISSGDSRCNILNEPFSPKSSNLATHPEDEDHSSELPKPETAAAAQPNDDKAEKCNTSEANSTLHSAPGVGGFEFDDLPQSGLLVPDGHFNTLNNCIMVNNKASNFNLDETLDLEANFLVTSTPMTSNKTSSEQTAGANLAVQKKLYRDDPNKPTDKAATNIPSNIICDRKTFLPPPISRALRPPSKTTSYMLKNPRSTVPEQLERTTTGLPVKRQRTQAVGVKTAAVAESQGTSGMSSSYNLRPLAPASKLPTSGLQRPQQSGVPSVFSKAAPGLRPLSTKSNRFSSSSTNKPTEPTAMNPVTKSSQGKKHPLSKGETLPISKRKKTDTVLPSSNTEATSSSNDTTNRVKTLKQSTTSLKSAPSQTPHSSSAAGPTGSSETSTSCDVSNRLRALKPPGAGLKVAKPQGNECSRCCVLKGKLKQQMDEIQRLKQELQKYQEQMDN